MSEESTSYVRAIKLAQESNQPREKIVELQRKAVIQYVFEYRNYEGLMVLIREYGISKQELREIVEEHRQKYPAAPNPTYDFHSGKSLTQDEWIEAMYGGF